MVVIDRREWSFIMGDQCVAVWQPSGMTVPAKICMVLFDKWLIIEKGVVAIVAILSSLSTFGVGR